MHDFLPRSKIQVIVVLLEVVVPYILSKHGQVLLLNIEAAEAGPTRRWEFGVISVHSGLYASGPSTSAYVKTYALILILVVITLLVFSVARRRRQDHRVGFLMDCS
jgi:hypothetical protein